MGIFDPSKWLFGKRKNSAVADNGEKQGDNRPNSHNSSSDFDARVAVNPSFTKNADPNVLLSSFYSALGIDRVLINNPKSRELLDAELDHTVISINENGVLEVNGVRVMFEMINAVRYNSDYLLKQIREGANRWNISDGGRNIEFPVYPEHFHDGGGLTTNKYAIVDGQDVIIGEHSHNFYPNAGTDFHSRKAQKYDSNGTLIAKIETNKGTIHGTEYNNSNVTSVETKGELREEP